MKPEQVICIGLGRVGLTLGLELAREGHQVLGVDKEASLITRLQQRKSPFVEPSLDETLDLSPMEFSTKLPKVFKNHQIIFVCVGTPMKDNGQAECRDVLKVMRKVIKIVLKSPGTQYVVLKSTVPVGTYDKKIQHLLPKDFFKKNYFFHHPEFMREGNCFKDIRNPNPNIIGSTSKKLKNEVKKRLSILPLFEEIKVVDIKTSEMIKYMNNSFHALKVVFANEMASYSSSQGVNVEELFNLFLSDKKLNISGAYLKPGFSFGGSCLSKEVKALSARSGKIKLPLIDSILSSNNEHSERLFKKIKNLSCKKILVCGVTFKPNTDDLRESPLLEITRKLNRERNTSVTVLDSDIVLEKVQEFNHLGKEDRETFDLIILGPYKISLKKMSNLMKNKTKIIDLGWYPDYQKLSTHPNYMGAF